ncbi:hypothetical protein E2C01_016621 [Portunus trituberculatus]|uniref:Uncharacterized protein n=1 Tax=Portunus trituberculatus TaxID=210409 RepID=A0A5B7DR90_PORTR|nr:hypothetical protein [Portunus trituberculatus]
MGEQSTRGEGDAWEGRAWRGRLDPSPQRPCLILTHAAPPSPLNLGGGRGGRGGSLTEPRKAALHPSTVRGLACPNHTKAHVAARTFLTARGSGPQGRCGAGAWLLPACWDVLPLLPPRPSVDDAYYALHLTAASSSSLSSNNTDGGEGGVGGRGDRRRRPAHKFLAREDWRPDACVPW